MTTENRTKNENINDYVKNFNMKNYAKSISKND